MGDKWKMSTKAITKMQNRYDRYEARYSAYQIAGKAMKASKVLLKMQKLAKKLAKKGVSVQVGVRGVVGGVPFQAVGALQVGAGVGRKVYSVSLLRGAIQYQAPSGRIITLGYTPAKAKKKYRTKRRRKRLTQRDRAILAAIQANPAAAPAIALMT